MGTLPALSGLLLASAVQELNANDALHRLITVCFRPVSNNAVLYVDQVKVEVIP